MVIHTFLAVQSSNSGTDSVARIIAAWGAVVATIVLALQLIRFRRERPRLQVHAHPAASLVANLISIQVVNPSNAPPVTVMDVGLMATHDSILEVEDDEGSEVQVRHMLGFHSSKKPILLSEGETKIFDVRLESMPPVVQSDGDEEFRAYVIDAEGRFIRGNRGRFFHTLLDMGWKPSPRAKGHAFETSSMLLVPDGRFARLRWHLKHR